MPLRILLEPGDCFSIPLPDGRFACGQYIQLHPLMGCLIRVFDLKLPEPPVLKNVAFAGELFPPIFVGLNPPVRQKRWKKIGNLPIHDFRWPRFRSSFSSNKGVNDDWNIWDGKDYKHVGLLPEEGRKLEGLGVWPFDSVEERILTGRDPFYEGVE
jgi:hypothetical protein